MKIFYIHYKHDYGKDWKITRREYMNDYYLWYLPLVAMAKEHGHEVQPFWVDEMVLQKGRRGMTEALRDAIFAQKPDVCFFFCGTEFDFDRKILAEIRDKTTAITVYFGVDEAYRFDLVSKGFAPYFSWVVTWCYGADEKYRKIGCRNVLKSHIGINLNIYHPLHVPKDIDVGFVGTYGKLRGEVIQYLRDSGVNVLVRGNGWPEGGASQDEMINIFSRSKIVLALNTPEFHFNIRSFVRFFLRRAYLGEGGSPVKLDVGNFFGNVKSWWQKRAMTIRARNFEVPACGTLLMTQDAENLRDFYVPGKEIVIYKDNKDLLEKIHYYLAHPEEREAIAKRGYERTVRDHSIEKRWNEVFSTIGRPL